MCPLLTPAWPLPDTVDAALSTRAGGVSQAPFASLNLGIYVGDDPAATAENRARFAAALGVVPRWLHLVHGNRVLELKGDDLQSPLPPADAGWTRARRLACTVQAADCMPVLFALRDGSAVAAAHAGWRGLAGGVLRNTVQALCAGTGAQPEDVLAWLGPCIGPRQFEVGADVLQAFGHDLRHDLRHGSTAADPERFAPRPRADGAARWLAHLPLLARDQLAAAAVPAGNIVGDGRCTVEDASLFFSFRRDGRTGRMAAAVWRR